MKIITKQKVYKAGKIYTEKTPKGSNEKSSSKTSNAK